MDSDLSRQEMRAWFVDCLHCGLSFEEECEVAPTECDQCGRKALQAVEMTEEERRALLGAVGAQG